MSHRKREDQLSKYLEINEAYQPAVVPGQRIIIFISKKSGLPQVWKWDEEKQPEQSTDLPNRVLSVYHSHSGEQTVVGMDKDGNEKQQFYLIEQIGQHVVPLIIPEDHFHRFGGWSSDDQKIADTSNRRHPGFFDVYCYDFTQEKELLLYEVDDQCTPIGWTKDEEYLILSMPETNVDSAFYLFHIKTKNMFRLGQEEPYISINEIC